MLYYILVVTLYNVANRWNVTYLGTCWFLFDTAPVTVWFFGRFNDSNFIAVSEISCFGSFEL